MAEQDMEKTEAPTPRRREEARQEGNVARSGDLNAAVALLGAVVLLNYLGLKVLTELRLLVAGSLSGEDTLMPARADDTGALMARMGWAMAVTTGPLVAAVAAMALAISLGQVGFLVNSDALQPKFSRLSPLRGLAGLFDMRAGMRLVMSIAKIIIIGAVAGGVVAADLPRILSLSQLELLPAFGSAAEMVFDLSLKLAALLFVLAVGDYLFQYWQRERDLRMTKDEIKEELKRMEGDPLIRQRRSRVARQLAMQRMGQAVPKADVIVTNPTHFAVALKYDSKDMRAPKVVAKGADLMAFRIRQLAVAAGVPMVERRELARALYKSVEVGQEIPPQYYGAVAEILAYVYRLSGRKTA